MSPELKKIEEALHSGLSLREASGGKSRRLLTIFLRARGWRPGPDGGWVLGGGGNSISFSKKEERKIKKMANLGNSLNQMEQETSISMETILNFLAEKKMMQRSLIEGRKRGSGSKWVTVVSWVDEDENEDSSDDDMEIEG